MKKLILFLSVLLLSASVFAQPDPRRVPPHSRPKPETVPRPSDETTYIPLDATAAPCQMTVKDAPTINGAKLGLSPDELSKALKIKIIPGAPNQLGVSSFSILGKKRSAYFLEGITYIYSALPNGINSINLNFFNNHLYYSLISFDNAATKQTLDKFALALSEKYNFSKAWFKTSREILVNNEIKTQVNDNYVYLFCPRELRFTLQTAGEDGFQLEILDLKADVQITEKHRQINSSKPQ